MNLEDVNMFPKPELHPIVFEELYVNESKAPMPDFVANPTQVHLYVLVHGF